MNPKHWWVTGLVMGLVILAQNQSNAEDSAFTGARSVGMAGANAASVRDATAQWHNPAAFGFFSHPEWETNAVDNNGLSGQGFSSEIVGIGVGYAMTENMGRYLDILADIDFEAFNQGELSSPQNVRSLLALAGTMGSLDRGDGLHADVSAGTSYQFGHFGIGLRMSGEAAAWTLPDRVNLSLDDFPAVADMVDDLNGAASSEGFNDTYTLTDDQRNTLASALGGISPDSDTIKYLDDKFEQLRASGTLSSAEIEKAVELFSSLVPGSGGNIESNLTAVVGHGFALVEVPVSYGWAVNKNLSFGTTVKIMHGSVMGTKVWIFNDHNDQVYEDLSDSVESSMNIGLDLGVLYRIPKFQFAAVGHNLNRPSFNGFTDTVDLAINGGATQSQTITVPDVNIDPQLTVGAACMPLKHLTLESNLDLLKAGTLLPGYDIQRLSFGGELDMRFLAVRLGAYRNLAEPWQDWVATAGFGVNLAVVKVDVGGAYSLGNNVQYDGSEIPSEARLYASLGLDF